VNPQHIKAVPGGKTDSKDCEWIAELLQHGLLKGSFVPPTAIQDLRDLTRYRAELRQSQNRVANRIQKLLEQANLKLSSVVSNTLGVSGRLMLEAIIAGGEDPEKLAQLARGRLKGKIPQLKQALQGRVRVTALSLPGGLGCRSNQKLLSVRPVPTFGRATGNEAGIDGSSSYHARHRLPRTQERAGLPRTRR
jgi:hypothetical protein